MVLRCVQLGAAMCDVRCTMCVQLIYACCMGHYGTSYKGLSTNEVDQVILPREIDSVPLAAFPGRSWKRVWKCRKKSWK